MTNKNNEKVEVVDMHIIHNTDETWERYQILHTDETKVLQAMVLPRELVEQLIRRAQEVLSKEELGL